MAAVGLTMTTESQRGSGLPSVVAALAAATSTSGAVVHTVDDGPHVDDVTGAPKTTGVERWARVDGTAVRVRTSYADGSFQDMLSERAGDQSRLTVYQSKTNVMTVGALVRDTTPHPSRTADPLLQQVRAYASAVTDGNARVDGETEIGGRTTLRVVDAAEGPAAGTAWYIDRGTATPTLVAVEGACRRPDGRCPQPTVYDTFEVVPHADAVSLPEYAGGRIVREDG